MSGLLPKSGTRALMVGGRPYVAEREDIANLIYFYTAPVDDHDKQVIHEMFMLSGNRTLAGRSLSILSAHLVITLKSQGSSP